MPLVSGRARRPPAARALRSLPSFSHISPPPNRALPPTNHRTPLPGDLAGARADYAEYFEIDGIQQRRNYAVTFFQTALMEVRHSGCVAGCAVVRRGRPAAWVQAQTRAG
jgi:hypothetical protein